VLLLKRQKKKKMLGLQKTYKYFLPISHYRIIINALSWSHLLCSPYSSATWCSHCAPARHFHHFLFAQGVLATWNILPIPYFTQDTITDPSYFQTMLMLSMSSSICPASGLPKSLLTMYLLFCLLLYVDYEFLTYRGHVVHLCCYTSR
jgi:hypothetical protein